MFLVQFGGLANIGTVAEGGEGDFRDPDLSVCGGTAIWGNYGVKKWAKGHCFRIMII